jgi:hypothetical protein
MALPAIKVLLLEEPLYKPYAIAAEDGDAISRLVGKQLQFDCYCPSCRQPSTFSTYVKGEKQSTTRTENEKVVQEVALSDLDFKNFFSGPKNQQVPKAPTWLSNRDFPLTAYCSRYEHHVMRFYFAIRNKQLIKVGQHPSLADVANAELQKYRKVLGEERGAELYKAIGLAAHGIGVGSFVYLRRVFESLLAEHKDRAASSGHDIPGYNTMKVGERIEALRLTLPDFLIGNKVIYGILSLGIHSATEDQCLVAFPVLKNAILLILQLDAERLEREATLKTLTKDIADAASTFKGS